MRRLLALALTALFVGAGCGSFGLRAHTISLAFKAGDTFRYTLHAKLDYTIGAQGLSMPVKLELNAKDTVTVKSVDTSGNANVTVELTDLTITSTSNGTEKTHVSKSETFDLKVAPDGRILSVNGSAVASGALPDFSGQSSGLVTAILPDGSVKVGDTWSKSYDVTNPRGSGTVHVTADNKYVRDEKVGNVDTSVVQSKITTKVDLTFQTPMSDLPIAQPNLPIKGLESFTVKATVVTDVTSWIDANGHRMVKTHATGNTDATLTFNSASANASPVYSGPITFKGTQSVELDPA